WIEMAESFRAANQLTNFNKCWKNFFLSRTFVEDYFKAHRIQEYFATIREHSIPFHDGLRSILLPYRDEVVADLEIKVRDCARIPSELNPEISTKNALEFLQLVSDTLSSESDTQRPSPNLGLPGQCS